MTEHSAAYQRFMQSVKDCHVYYNPAYDYDALDELPEHEKIEVTNWLINAPDQFVFELRSLIRIGSPAAISAIEEIARTLDRKIPLRSTDQMMLLESTEYLHSIGKYDDLAGTVCRILEGNSYSGVLQHIGLIAKRLRSHRIERAMLKAALRNPTESQTKHIMRFLSELRGQSIDIHHDWNKSRSILGLFQNRRQRCVATIKRICRQIGLDWKAALSEQ